MSPGVGARSRPRSAGGPGLILVRTRWCGGSEETPPIDPHPGRVRRRAKWRSLAVPRGLRRERGGECLVDMLSWSCCCCRCSKEHYYGERARSFFWILRVEPVARAVFSRVVPFRPDQALPIRGVLPAVLGQWGVGIASARCGPCSSMERDRPSSSCSVIVSAKSLSQFTVFC